MNTTNITHCNEDFEKLNHSSEYWDDIPPPNDCDYLCNPDEEEPSELPSDWSIASVSFVSEDLKKETHKETQSREVTTLKTALSYAAAGWPVFPAHSSLNDGTCSCRNKGCSRIGKHPKTPSGFKDATTDESTIRAWFSKPNTNIGIVTGQASKICVIDVDAKNGGVDSIKAFETKYGKLPDTPMVLTGSGNGSAHYYFKCPPEGLPSRIGILEGVDFKCDGGYVIAPPSVHKSGREYAWDVGFDYADVPLADLPSFLINLICKNFQFTDALPKLTEPDGSLGSIKEGERNNTLFRLASSIRNKGGSEDGIRAFLSIENQKRCSPSLPESEIMQIVSSVMKYELKQDVWTYQNVEDDWLPTIPLPSTEIIVPVMPADLLPEALHGWIKDGGERMQIPLEMIAVPVICVISALIGCRLYIAPKRYDDWKLPPNLWAAIIAPPGYMKSPAIKEAMKFASALEAKAKKEHKEELRKYEKALKEYEARKKQGEVFDKSPPKLRRLITNDATVEKIGQILSDNDSPAGIVQQRDELFGFLKNLEKKGREGDKQFFLEGYNGDSPFTYDRIERGTIDIDKLCISILGGIQPERFEEYFSSLLENGSGGDGFLPRFQLIIYPQRIAEWKYVDRPPDQAAKEKAKRIFDQIYDMDFKALGLSLCPDDDVPICKFTDEAQLLFIEWYEKHQRYIRSGEIFSPIIEEHIVKNAKLVPALSLIFAVIGFCDSNSQNEKLEVRKQDLQKAIDWCEYLHQHMYKVYSAVQISPHISAAHAIIKRIQSKEIFDGMIVRILKRHKWSKLAEDEIVDQALALLGEHNWLKIEEIKPSSLGGAPSKVIRLNPSLIQMEEKSED